MPPEREYSVAVTLRALEALRLAAGLPEQRFSLPAFVGMVSDEIQALREQGRTDAEIVELIRANSGIELGVDDLARFYATPEERGRHEQHPSSGR